MCFGARVDNIWRFFFFRGRGVLYTMNAVGVLRVGGHCLRGREEKGGGLFIDHTAGGELEPGWRRVFVLLRAKYWERGLWRWSPIKLYRLDKRRYVLYVFCFFSMTMLS